MYRWLRRGTQGELVFDARPYVCHDAVTSKRIVISLYDSEAADGIIRYSGTFSAYFRCHNPFGRLKRIWHDSDVSESELIHTGVLPAGMKPDIPTAESRNLLLYNPGTERAQTVIRIAGDVGSGLLIRNFTTGQRCSVVGLTADSLLPGAALELDSAMGQTRIALGEDTSLAFALHNEGYIELAPCTPFVRSVRIRHTAGSNVIASEGCFVARMAGQFLYLDGWKKLRQITSADMAILSEPADRDGETDTPIVTMNEIELSGDGFALTRLEIDCVPRIR